MVAVLVKRGRADRALDVTVLEKSAELRVVADVLGRKALLDEVGHEFCDCAGVDHGAGELVIAKLSCLFDDQDRGRLNGADPVSLSVLVVGLDLLGKVVGRGQIAGPRANKQNVDFHALAFDFTHRLILPLMKLGICSRPARARSSPAESDRVAVPQRGRRILFLGSCTANLERSV